MSPVPASAIAAAVSSTLASNSASSASASAFLPSRSAIMPTSDFMRAMLSEASEPAVTRTEVNSSSWGMSDSSSVSMTTRSGFRPAMESTDGSWRVPTSVTVSSSGTAAPAQVW